MTDNAATTRCDSRDGTCHVCGDEATEGRIVAIDDAARIATVEFESGVATVALDLVDARVGDRLLVHLGFAIQRLDAP